MLINSDAVCHYSWKSYDITGVPANSTRRALFIATTKQRPHILNCGELAPNTRQCDRNNKPITMWNGCATRSAHYAEERLCNAISPLRWGTVVQHDRPITLKNHCGEQFYVLQYLNEKKRNKINKYYIINDSINVIS